MHNIQSVLTTRQLADAIGVSESSVKRWIDEGRIEATRTAGGHRRVSLQEASRYIRDHGVQVARPDRLGLPDLAAYLRRGDVTTDTGEALYDFLTAGAAAEASGLLISRFLAGTSVAEIVDGPLVHAMTKVGELWRAGDDGIFVEHRATETAIQAIVRLRALLPAPGEAVAAVGGAPSGDPYVLPSLTAATVLEDEGLRATNLGPETPVDTLTLGVETLSPRVVWLSVSVAVDPDVLRQAVLALVARLETRGAVLVLGGAQADRLTLPRRDSLYVGRSMTELRAIVRGMRLTS